jgi:ATP-dependent protease HslVU (ClpYQ) peptidase subunit
MTCVVGISNGRRVLIGADSAFSDNNNVIVTDSPQKAWRLGDFAVGFCGDMDCIVSQRRELGKTEYSSIEEIVDAINEHAPKNASYEYLIAKGAKLWCGTEKAFWSCQDRRSGRRISRASFAIGSGAEIALGALYDPRHRSDHKKVLTALEAAAYHTNGVRPPFRIVST